jgi:cell fate regulator YaaT (PSP1 superfamily)
MPPPPPEELPPEVVAPKTVVVRYGYLKQIGEFVSELTSKVGCGSKLVCRTSRGLEICEMLTTTCANGGCEKSVSRDKLLEYINASGGRDYPFSEEGRVLRVATAQDLAEQARLDENRKKDLTAARELVVQHHLQMKIAEIEYLLGRERVMVYFTSEHRVDFRQLVRDLAHQLHARIELRQVGARDEARLTADYEKCGQHCCCKQFLKVLTPISMRSAKIQKATLDPAKISGRCGRLMCCLRYEDQTYEELRKKLPKRNTRVKTETGDAWVLDGQILTQLVLVQHDDGKRTAIPIEQILAFDQPRPKLPNGVTMQSPNDRMPEPRFVPGQAGPPGAGGPGAPAGPGGPRRGPGGPGGPGGPPRGPGQGGPNRGPIGPGGPQQGPRGPRPNNQSGGGGGPQGGPRGPGRGGPPQQPRDPASPGGQLRQDGLMNQNLQQNPGDAGGTAPTASVMPPQKPQSEPLNQAQTFDQTQPTPTTTVIPPTISELQPPTPTTPPAAPPAPPTVPPTANEPGAAP